MFLFLGDVFIELGGFLIVGIGCVSASVMITISSFLLFPPTFVKIKLYALFLNIISR